MTGATIVNERRHAALSTHRHASEMTFFLYALAFCALIRVLSIRLFHVAACKSKDGSGYRRLFGLQKFVFIRGCSNAEMTTCASAPLATAVENRRRLKKDRARALKRTRQRARALVVVVVVTIFGGIETNDKFNLHTTVMSTDNEAGQQTISSLSPSSASVSGSSASGGRSGVSVAAAAAAAAAAAIAAAFASSHLVASLSYSELLFASLWPNVGDGEAPPPLYVGKIEIDFRFSEPARRRIRSLIVAAVASDASVE